MKRVAMLALASLSLAVSAAAGAKDNGPAPTAEQKARIEQLKTIQQGLHPQTGDIALAQADAVLHLGDDYYYLPPDEARRIIVDAWGNPTETAQGVLGLVFPKGKTFADDTWGAVITYEASGYVTDEDAQSADYNQLLSDMRSGEETLNARRTQGGYPAQHLVGWAQQPVYDPRVHSVVWAQNIQFTGSSDNSLNYDVRLLGRRGVLSLNMVTTMSKLAETRIAANSFAGSAQFTPGARYADFKQGDAMSGYGIAGLVAAGAGVVAAKKLGLIGLILVFGKKFFILILAAFGGITAWFRRKFRGGDPAAAEPSHVPEADATSATPMEGEAGLLPEEPGEGDIRPSPAA
jgi:uncharacterized membrane-anchored protein